MKLSNLLVGLMLALSVSTSAFAFGDNVINGGIKDSYNLNSNNTTNNTDNSVRGGAASSSATGGAASVGGVGNGIGNFSPSATIERGAVTSTNTNANTNVNHVKNDNINAQGQQQGQQQGQLQGQGQSQSANNEGNTQTINVAASKTYRPPVSSAIAPTIFPTAPCMGSSSVGATGTLFSISGGTTWTSEECMILETARSFDQAGYQADGLSVRCQGKWAKAAPSCKALAEQKAAVVPSPKLVMTKELSPESVAAVTPEQVEVVTARKFLTEPVYSSNGYYSTVTNPLAQ